MEVSIDSTIVFVKFYYLFKGNFPTLNMDVCLVSKYMSVYYDSK